MEKIRQRKRYVILPGTGIASHAMESAVFKQAHGASIAQEAKQQVERYFELSSANTVVASAITSVSSLADTLEEADFELISQRFADGPATVRMSESAKMALAAINPDFRIVPVTRYYIPGYKPRGKTMLAALPAAVDANDAVNGVYMTDVKQHFLAGLAIENHENGAGVTIGVVDSGIDNQHPALTGRVALMRCLVPGEDPNAGGPVDWGPNMSHLSGHGTHVAGIIAGEGGHGGPGGVAPAANLISYRIFPNNPTGMKGAENGAIIDAIRAAVEDDCRVINLSIEGSGLKDDGVRSAIADAWSQGVLCIAAAGNGFGNPVSYPAAHPHCVAVTAVGREGSFPPMPELEQYVGNQRSQIDQDVFLASFSNFGPRVQFTGPGHAIVSTFPHAGWWFNSGTSMAAPFVTGILALLLASRPNVLGMIGNADRSASMLQMLIAQAKMLRLPQAFHEGYGLPA
ncbi:S8 family peptidase [Rhizobium leguminosarum]|uniref:S8 family peptidase n=1 Tax=Rhizobium TaxID=379 RepID=UPI001030459D|nr:S8 family serine peptidase [Rhizobium leguminosarum]TAV40662.1 hypothetical protein ELI31_35375 [Rhizobium leguminosarum]TAV41230.1 hypothetical protein ELI32_35370 [Rhizobium leguminosarum]TAV61095.1 hypothetical protein ELI30_35160 [Rhizobium leguminosarum]TAY61127.1 hypothetical protein ELH82_33080 [Rhizobium leguminosarum]